MEIARCHHWKKSTLMGEHVSGVSHTLLPIVAANAVVVVDFFNLLANCSIALSSKLITSNAFSRQISLEKNLW